MNPAAPEGAVVEEAARLLKAGRVIGAPSDTVYGLLGLACSPKALLELQRLKSREGPFLRLAGSLAQVEALCEPLEPRVRAGLEAIWPGPVTVVLPVGGEPQGLAFRVPRDAWLLRLLDEIGSPLLSTSANPRGEPAPHSAVEVVSWFPDLPLIIDGGKACSGRPSTLVDARTWPGRVLRGGDGDAGPLLRTP